MNWMRFRPIYFLISGIALSLALYSIFFWGLKPSIDFTGGAVVEYQFKSTTSLSFLRDLKLQEEQRLEIKGIKALGDRNFEFRFGPDFTQEKAENLSIEIAKFVKEKPGVVRFESVGPVLSQEILGKTYTAVVLASLGILFWVAIQFKSGKLGAMAILAVLHDLIILLGTFAFLGHYKGVEIDILFVTAMLTIFSLSLYDTIIVYDRIRESQKKLGSSLGTVAIANRAISETIVRSFNTSLTTAFTLFALFLMGGATIKWFVLALLIGTISGTYSSPFVAVPLLVSWEELRGWWKTHRR